MGLYGTTCPNCGGPALFFSGGPSIICSNCSNADVDQFVKSENEKQTEQYDSYIVPKTTLVQLIRELHKYRESLMNCRVERYDPQTIKYIVNRVLGSENK